MQSLDHKDSLGEFVAGLFDLFVFASKILGNKKMEYIYIPPSKKKNNKKNNKKRKLYYYKIAHIFLNKPKITINSDQGKTVSLKLKKQSFNDSIKKIKNNLFFKK